MIHIKNIHIAFDETLIENGTLTIAPYQLTVIQGHSGSGKTSLLYIAGMISNDQQRIYKFNDHIIQNNDDEMALFRKKHIGYVFQENSLIEHLSIYENMKLYAAMIGKDISEKETQQLLEKVRLDKDIHQSTTTLSGGERQRLAIACAISKQPELLILDEPTSALDHTNMQLIMNILKELASQGMMILLASHDEEVVAQCETIYQIKNQQLLCNHKIEETNKTLERHSIHLKPQFYLSYFLNYLKENFWIHIIMFMMCGFSIATLMSSHTINQSFNDKQLINMDAIGNREIFITSQLTEDGQTKYRKNLPELHSTFISRIQSNFNTEIIYPFYEAWTNSFIINGEKKGIHATIQPYTKEKRIFNYLYEGQKKDNGIYISYGLSKDIQCNDKIQLELLLPNEETFQLDTLTIDGILQTNVENWYSTATNIIYVPIEMLPELEKVQSLLVYATHFDKTELLLEEIKNLDSSIGIFNHYSRTQYLSEAFELMKSFAPMIIGMIVLITCILVFLIYSRYISHRKKEICLLKVNGLSKKEIMTLILYELSIQAISVAFFSMIFINLLYLFMSAVFEMSIGLASINDYFKSVIVAFLFMSIPSLLSLIIYQRYDIGKALRNE